MIMCQSCLNSPDEARHSCGLSERKSGALTGGGGQTERGIWTELVVEMGTQKQGVSHHQLLGMSNVGTV